MADLAPGDRDATYYNVATLVIPFALMMELIVKDISENAVRLAV